MADTVDLKSIAARRESSNLSARSCENQKPPRGSQWLILISDIFIEILSNG